MQQLDSLGLRWAALPRKSQCMGVQPWTFQSSECCTHLKDDPHQYPRLRKPHSCSSTKRQTRPSQAKLLDKVPVEMLEEKATPLQLRNICARYPVRMFDSLKIPQNEGTPKSSKYISISKVIRPLKCWNNHGLAHQEPHFARNLETSKPRNLDFFPDARSTWVVAIWRRTARVTTWLGWELQGYPYGTPYDFEGLTFQTWWIDFGLFSKITL